MKYLIIILALISFAAQAQFNQSQKPSPGIVKYDFDTYKGDPIKKGWLFSDSTYRKLFVSYNAADTMVTYFQKQGERLEKIADEFQGLKKEYDAKAEGDTNIIMSQQEDIGKLNTLLNQSTKQTDDLLKQFWKVGSIRLHKGTTIAIGVPCLLLGYMVGKAF